MTPPADQEVSPRRRGRRWLWGSAVVVAVVAVVVVAVSWSSDSHSPASPGLAKPVPPLNSFILPVLNEHGRWAPTRQLYLKFCQTGYNYNNGPEGHPCSFMAEDGTSRSSYVTVAVDDYTLWDGAAPSLFGFDRSLREARDGFAEMSRGRVTTGDRESFATPTQGTSARPVPGVGEEAAAWPVDMSALLVRFEGEVPGPGVTTSYRGASLVVRYRQLVFSVSLYGIHYHKNPDGGLTGVKGFTFDEALPDVKNVAQQMVARLPLYRSATSP